MSLGTELNFPNFKHTSRSHLFPTNTIGTFELFLCLMIPCLIGSKSSRLLCEVILYTKTNPYTIVSKNSKWIILTHTSPFFIYNSLIAEKVSCKRV